MPPAEQEDRRYRWPTDGVHHTSTQLNIFWHEFVGDPNCYQILGGQADRHITLDETYVERIRNPTAAPDAWNFGDGGGPGDPVRFLDMNIEKYTAGALTNLPVAVWGAAIVKETSHTYIYGHTVQEEGVGQCYSCTNPPDPASCTPNSNQSPTGRAKDAVLFRVPAGQSIRTRTTWEYWWNDVAGHNCATPVTGCAGQSGADCWCKDVPNEPSDLRVVAPNVSNYFSVDKITIGSNMRYVMVHGGTFLEPLAYVRIGYQAGAGVVDELSAADDGQLLRGGALHVHRLPPRHGLREPPT